MRTILVLSMLVAVGACKSSTSELPKRVSLHRTGGTTFELRPEEDQHPYCLAYTVTKKGLIRQLTMSKANESFDCAPGKAIGLRSFKVPLNEGPVKVYVLFTSQKVNAGSVAQQLLDTTDRQKMSVMELRLPGTATMDTVEFAPEEDVDPTMGGELGADGGTIQEADAGSAPAPSADAGTPDSGT